MLKPPAPSSTTCGSPASPDRPPHPLRFHP